MSDYDLFLWIFLATAVITLMVAMADFFGGEL